MKTCLIYGLSSSADNVIRYIGQTTQSLHERFKSHRHDSLKNHKKMHRKINAWLRENLLNGNKISYHQICIGKWNETEKDCIKAAKTKGWNLLNETNGGQGGATFTGKKLTEEHKKKLSIEKMGKRLSDESIAKMAASKRGKKLTEEHKQKLKGRIPWNKGKRYVAIR